MHNDRIRKLWPPTSVPTPEELREFDQRTTEDLNGDDGGDYAPTTRIGIGGDGVTIYGTGGLAGPISTGRRRTVGGGLVFGDSDYQQISPATTRSFVMPLTDFFSRADVLRVEDNGSNGSDPFATRFPYDASVPGVLKNVGSPSQGNPAPDTRPTRFALPIPARYLVHGATISSFRLTWRADFTWTTPATGSSADLYGLPSLRVIRLQNGVYANGASDIFNIPQYVAGTFYNVGDLVLPNTGPNGHAYRVLQAGTLATNPPVWLTNNGGIVTEVGGLRFQTEPGPTTSFGHFCAMPWATSIATPVFGSIAANAPQQIVMPANCLNVSASVIDLVNYSYVLEIYDPSAIEPSGVLTSVVPITRQSYLYHSFRMTLANVAEIRPVY